MLRLSVSCDEVSNWIEPMVALHRKGKATINKDRKYCEEKQNWGYKLSTAAGRYGLRRGVLVRESSRLISFSNLSNPPCGRLPAVTPSTAPLAPCLSNKYVKRFFFSSDRLASMVNRYVSSLKTSCAAVIAAAADSRTRS